MWTETKEMNTKIALLRALEHGFGIETDIRDFGTEIVISHDPAIGGELALEELFEAFAHSESTLALNIKSDGLSHKLAKIIPESERSHYFAFDMSGPEYFKYGELGIRTFDRRSEFETGFGTGKKPDGIWLDAFTRDSWMLEWLAGGDGETIDTVVVSPELHGRPHLDFWRGLKELNVTDKLSICTDFPIEASIFFGRV